MKAHNVTLKPGSPSSRTTYATVGFVDTNNSILLDVSNICNNTTVESAKELIKALETAIADAEKFAARPVASDIQMVKHKGITYYLPEGTVSGFNLNERRLMEYATLVVGSNGYVIKNRHGA